MIHSLQNKKVIIIGGSSGIGFAVAKLIAAEGANITIASRTKKRLEKAAAAIEGNVEIDTIDTLNEDSIKDFFTRHNRIDHLLNFLLIESKKKT